MKKKITIPMTALIVSFNEASKLKNCLESFQDCSDLVVVDLGSNDNSIQIAKDMGARVFRHQWVPVVEMVWPKAVEYAQNPWVIRADPDEVYPKLLFKDVDRIIKSTPYIGMIRVPHRFYFRKKPLYYTRWGQIKSSPKVFHKERVILKPLVHSGIICKTGYTEAIVAPNKQNLVLHYWSDSYYELFMKHWRYIKKEGEAQYQSGKRFSLRTTIEETYTSLNESLIKFKGIRGGFDATFLSFFHAWYTFMVSISLKLYQKRISNKNNLKTS